MGPPQSGGTHPVYRRFIRSAVPFVNRLSIGQLSNRTSSRMLLIGFQVSLLLTHHSIVSLSNSFQRRGSSSPFLNANDMQNLILVTGGAGFIGSNFILQWILQESSPVPLPDWLTRDTVVPGAGGSDAERMPRRTRRGRCSFAARGPRRRVLTARDRGASLHRSMNAGFLLCEFTAKPLRKSVLELHRPRESHQAPF